MAPFWTIWQNNLSMRKVFSKKLTICRLCIGLANLSSASDGIPFGQMSCLPIAHILFFLTKHPSPQLTVTFAGSDQLTLP